MRRTANLLVLTLLLGGMVAADTVAASASLQKARRLFENRNYRAASAEFRAIVAAYPTSNEAAVAAYYIGLSEERQGNRQAALDAYNQMTQKYSTAELARFARQRAIEVENDLKNNPAGVPASQSGPSPDPVRVDPVRVIPPNGVPTGVPTKPTTSPRSNPRPRPAPRNWPQPVPQPVRSASAQEGDGVLFPTEYLPASVPSRDELAVIEFPQAAPVVTSRPAAPAVSSRPTAPAAPSAPQSTISASLPAIAITPLAPAEPTPDRMPPQTIKPATAYGNTAVVRPHLPNSAMQGTAAAVSQTLLTPVTLPATVVPRPSEVISVRASSVEGLSPVTEPRPVNVVIISPRMPVVASSLEQTEFFRRTPAVTETEPVVEPAVTEPEPVVKPVAPATEQVVKPAPVTITAGQIPPVTAVIPDLPPRASSVTPAAPEVVIPVSIDPLSAHQVSRPPASIFAVIGGQTPVVPTISTDIVTPPSELVISAAPTVAPIEPSVAQETVPEAPAASVSRPLPAVSWEPVAVPSVALPADGGITVDLAPVVPEPTLAPVEPSAPTSLENMPIVGAPASSEEQDVLLPEEFEVGSQAPVSYAELAQLGAAGAPAARSNGLPAPAYTISITAVKAALKREAEVANAAQSRQNAGRLASTDPNVARNLSSSGAAPRVDQSILRAIGYRKMGQFDEAIAEYLKALELDPENAVARNNLADIYIARNERLDEAVALVTEALAMEPPDKGPYYSTLGWAYAARGDYENAEKYLNEAIKLKATAERLYRRGKVYAALGLAAKARADLDRALVYSEDVILSERIRQAIDEISTPLSRQVAPGNVR